MTKENVMEFLFEEKKYRIEKFGLMILFWLVVLYLSTVFRLSLTLIFIPVLMLICVVSIIKVWWYNKKKNIKTRVRDRVGMILCLIVLIAISFLYFKEKNLENAVYDVIEEKVGRENFTIEFIDEMENKENYIVVGYTIEDANAKYMEWYYWRDGELVHDLTREISDGND